MMPRSAQLLASALYSMPLWAGRNPIYSTPLWAGSNPHSKHAPAAARSLQPAAAGQGSYSMTSWCGPFATSPPRSGASGGASAQMLSGGGESCCASPRAGTEGSRLLIQAAAQKGAEAVQAREFTPAELRVKRRNARRLNLGQHLRPGYHGPRWTAEQRVLLGTLPDADVAAITGKTVNAVRVMRAKQVIPAVRPARRQPEPAPDRPAPRRPPSRVAMEPAWAANRGRQHTEEARQGMSEKHRRRGTMPPGINGGLGKMLAAMLLGIAEMEQETRRERQAAGIKLRRRGASTGAGRAAPRRPGRNAPGSSGTRGAQPRRSPRPWASPATPRLFTCGRPGATSSAGRSPQVTLRHAHCAEECCLAFWRRRCRPLVFMGADSPESGHEDGVSVGALLHRLIFLQLFICLLDLLHLLLGIRFFQLQQPIKGVTHTVDTPKP